MTEDTDAARLAEIRKLLALVEHQAQIVAAAEAWLPLHDAADRAAREGAALSVRMAVEDDEDDALNALAAAVRAQRGGGGVTPP